MSNNHGDIVIAAPAGYKWDEGTLKKITYVAEAGGVKYDSLQKAIDAAKSKAVVTMLADTRENVTISKALTLDLNGFTLNGSTGERKAALKVDNATVTVKDSSANQTGTIKREDVEDPNVTGSNSYYVIDIQGGNGLLIFEGGNVTNTSGIVGVKGASLVRLGDECCKRTADPDHQWRYIHAGQLRCHQGRPRHAALQGRHGQRQCCLRQL